jgi:hypothetical protein
MTAFNFKMNALYETLPLISDVTYEDLPAQEIIRKILTAMVPDLKSRDYCEEVEENLRVFDQNQGMVLIHYLDPTSKNKNHRLANRFHGLIIDLVEQRVVADAMPYTEEREARQIILTSEGLKYTDSEDEHAAILYTENISMMYALEGTVLRLFYSSRLEKWFLSTHRKIDGSRSRWSGPRFSSILTEEYPDFWDMVEKDFNKNNCYMLMVHHPANRLAHISTSAKVCCVNIFERSGPNSPGLSLSLDIPEFVGKIPTNKGLILPKSDWSTDINSFCVLVNQNNELLPITNNVLIYDHNLKGCIKLITPEYSRLRSLRGNEPNLSLRYMQLKYDVKDTDRLEEFMRLFPEHKAEFDKLANAEQDIAAFLADVYMRRYVQNKYVKLSHPGHFVLKTLHQTADRNMFNNDVQGAILEKLKLSNAGQMYTMYREATNPLLVTPSGSPNPKGLVVTR